MSFNFDLIVVGGGSGGFGASLAAARSGLKVLLVEAASSLGGNSTLGGVNTWEPGICGPGLSAELFENLSAFEDAIGLSRTVKHYSQEQPWGLSEIDRSLCYEQSRCRAGLSPDEWVRVSFEPESMGRAMEKLLRAAGVEIAFNTHFVGAIGESERVAELVFSSPQGQWRAHPNLVIDATANLHLARAANCATSLGEESRDTYNEPSAPTAPKDRLNGVSLCFRIEPVAKPRIEPLPSGIAAEPFCVSVSMTQYPNGDLNLNPLPIMEGIEYSRLCEQSGEAAARRECEHRVFRLWHWLQNEHGVAHWRIKHISSMMGVREGARLVGRRVLTEQDIRAGFRYQRDADHIVTVADHALDVHGEGHLCRELTSPYGVPYECLLPREYDNLAVACRGASFSHIAASSCRLSRTMIDLCHAAGLAAGLAVKAGKGFPDIDVADLRRSLETADVRLGCGDLFPAD